MKRNRLLHALVPLLLLSACNGKDPLETQQKVNSYKVAVVLPASEKAELSKIVDWAQETIKSAQKGQESRIELELEWVDEDGATLARDIARITHDNSYAAVIGPRYSRNARVIAKESLSYRMPVLAPSVTSTEFQRIYAGSNMGEPNIFCLAEAHLRGQQYGGAQYLLPGRERYGAVPGHALQGPRQ